MRRPVNAPFTLGDGNGPHAARGVGPAQDYGVPIGTPVYAMFPVTRLVKSGSASSKGGHTLTGHAANGDFWVVQHLSRWLTGVNPLGQVAYSGNSGTDTTGPHVHAWVSISGIRMNPEDYLAQLAAAEVTPFDPAKPPAEEEFMEPDSMFAIVDGVPSWCWINWAKGTVFAVHTQAEADWVGGYMGSVKFDWGEDPIGGDKYKNKLELLRLLNP